MQPQEHEFEKRSAPRTESRSYDLSQYPELEMERDFDVPVHQLFKAFTTSDAVKAWWWPKDLYTDHVDMDFSVSGKFFANMKGGTGDGFGGGGMISYFEDIVEDERIVMSDQFADSEGNVITAKDAKMPGEWPEKGRITLEFSALDKNRSRLHLLQEGIPQEMQKDCIQGWSQSFDKLGDYFAGRIQQ